MSLFEEVSGQDSQRARQPDLAAVAAYVVAAFIHLTTLAVAVLGGWLVVATWPSPVGIVIGLLVIALAVQMRPRFPKLPAGSRVLRRAEAPTLYGLLDRVSNALGGRPLDAIVVDQHFNASAGWVGLRQRRVLTLGLPLWNVLSPAERLALLGHEIGHFVNGDLRRGLVVGTALNAVGELHLLLRQAADMRGDEILGGFTFLVRVPLRLLSMLPATLLITLALLTLRAGQRAEYLADALAVRLASSQASAGVLRATMLGPGCMRALTFAAQRSRDTGGIWQVEREFVAGIPRTELERLARVAERESLRVDATHPPTHLRLRFAGARESEAAELVLDPAESRMIDRELAAAYSEIAAKVRIDLLSA
ncbi:M48 family metallopeptidase [Actinopolymorpha pittospori]|uniref:Zn-dependent protease with chaperone function n=1 Tax=Actinopolymorpha pittospori TaxID=648752 RepID=A0A927MYW2_9ACTN|nr:M48 family metallopeptidase [Actinopolymorpha pittospori]MBE1605695.1 Zn-dependent protease with chaperone function [Actinopolymorpha pittospori]